MDDVKDAAAAELLERERMFSKMAAELSLLGLMQRACSELAESSQAWWRKGEGFQPLKSYKSLKSYKREFYYCFYGKLLEG